MKNFYLKFFLRGKSEPFVYQVSEEDSKRIENCLTNSKLVTECRFLEFDDILGRAISINTSYILLCQVLWDFGLKVTLIEGEEENISQELILIMDGMEEPLRYFDTDIEEIYDLAFELRHIELRNDNEKEFFVLIHDEDGEKNLIKVNNIILMESIQYYLDEEEI